jgi:DNA polymerase I-like protein with 3'-5' exonuclease and polymerase domains/5'-3' exonuclease
MNNVTAILDLKGLVMHSYHASMSQEPIYGEIKEKINTASHGFTSFLSLYYDPIIDLVESPMNIIAVLDAGSLYRKTMYPPYKAHRSKVIHDPLEVAELEKLQASVKNFLASQGIPLVKVSNTEADDVVAYLVEKLQGQKLVYTVDQDLIALGNKADIMIRGVPTVDMKGVPPSCVTLFKSLTGDSSDGYPGVKGFGPKAWDSMVEGYGIDGMEELDDLITKGDSKSIKAIALQAENKAFRKAAGDYENWKLMHRVARLAPELCEGAKNQIDWFKRAPTLERLTSTMTDRDCPDLISKYSRDVYRTVLVTQDNLDDCLAEIRNLTPETPFVAWDYETHDPIKNPNYKTASNGRDYVSMLDSKVAGCSFAVGRNCNVVYYFAVDHRDTRNVDQSVVLEVIKHFETQAVEMVAQNISFEATITKNVFGHTLKYYLDTKLFSHHIDENNENGLKALSKRYLNYNQTSYAATLEAAGAKDMSEISGKQVLSYGADDSLVTAHLYHLFRFMTQLEGTYDFTKEFECPAVAPLVDAHIGGVKVDLAELERQKLIDEAMVVEKMAAIRETLEENCKGLNLEAVKALWADQGDYIKYKAKEALKAKNVAASTREISDAERQAETATLAKYREASIYTPYEEVITPRKVNLTVAGFRPVTKALGLPPIEKVTLLYISDWIQDNPSELAVLLKYMSNKDETKRDELRNYCAKYAGPAKVAYTGTELNMGSPPQNQALFYLMLGLPIRNRTKVQRGSMRDKAGFPGSPATDEAAVQFALANDCAEEPWKAQVLNDLLDYKSAATRLGIYWNPYPLWLDKDDVMHPGFNSCGTVTRRPTGSSPNLLQVSKGDVRKVFIPRSEDNVIVSVDFSSEELRIMAATCQDERFLSAYSGEQDLDLHALTGCGLAPLFLPRNPEVDPTLVLMDNPNLVNYAWFKQHQDDDSKLGKFLKNCRSMAKTANFGVCFGAGPATLALQLMIPLADGEIISEAMSRTYPGIEVWKAALYKEAKNTGYVTTAWGNRRHCGKNLAEGNRAETSRWERQLSNFVIQSTAADLLKVALVEIARNKTLEKHGARLIAPIYDELVIECPKATLQQCLSAICADMEQPIPGLSVPMVADCSFGPNWGTQYEVGNRPTQAVIDEALAKFEVQVQLTKAA